MKHSEIMDERQFYEAVQKYSRKIWYWGAHIDGDWDKEPTPDELIELLEKRIEWVRAHKRAVDRYLRKRGAPMWVRVFDGDADGANSAE